MALLGNYSVLHKSPARFMSGTIASGDRANWGKGGAARNFGAVVDASAADLAETKIMSIPHGQGAGGAWLLPRTSGGRHARANISLAASGTGALGVNIQGAANISISAAGVGGLVAGAVGAATISLGASGSIGGTVDAVGTATISMGGSANPGALGWLSGQATLTLDGTLVSYAIGHMRGTTEDQGLSVSGIANAVWAKIVDSGFSAQEILRLLAAHAAGDATGLEGSAPEFKSLDGTKTRIAGTLAAGDRTISSRDAS